MKKWLCCGCALLAFAAVAVAVNPPQTGTSDIQAAPTAAVKAPQVRNAPAPQQPVVMENMSARPLWNWQTTAQKAPANYVPQPVPESRGVRVECPDPTAYENEPDDCAHPDNFNGGCNSPPSYPFSTVACGARVYGESCTYLVGSTNYRDTDWYKITTTDPGTLLEMTVTADFPLLIGVVTNGGIDDCSTIPGTFDVYATGEAGVTVTVQRCVPPGTWYLFVGPSVFEGVLPGSGYCFDLACSPCVPPVFPECPPTTTNPGTLYGQRAYGQDEAWSLFVSNSMFYDWTDYQKLFEHFECLPAGVQSITIWGTSMIYDDGGFLTQCEMNPGTFQVQFWLNDEATNRPNLAAGPLQTYTPTVAKEDTFNIYAIDSDGDGNADLFLPLYKWTLTLPETWSQPEGWVSIMNTDYCWFWWAASPEGGTVHLAVDGRDPLVYSEEESDLGFCLVGNAMEQSLGACCDWNNDPPVCTNNVEIRDCCDFFMTFYPLETCTPTLCTAGLTPYACCDALGTCIADTYELYCLSIGGTWMEGRSCNESPSPCVVSPCPITCETGSIFGRPLSGSCWLFPSWVENDYSWVDDFSVATDINRVQWWAIGWDGTSLPNHDCDFQGLSDQTIRMRVYDEDYPAPPQLQPPITREGTATLCDSGYWFASITATIYRFEMIVTPAITERKGWYEIDQILGAGDCWHWRLSGINGNDIGYIRDNQTPPETMTQWGPDTPPDSPPYDSAACFYTVTPPGACCDESTGVCTNNVLQSNCTGNCKVFYRGLTCAQITEPCLPVTGACCRPDGTCDIVLKSACENPAWWLGCDTTCVDDCCIIVCPPGGIPEDEPVCFDGFVDNYNGGCNSTPNAFDPIAVGQTICGTAGLYASVPGGAIDRRDTDWYQFQLNTPGKILWHVRSEFWQNTYIMNNDCENLLGFGEGGVGLCNDFPATAALEAGTYWLFVSLYSNDDPPCGTPYLAWVTLEPAGACHITIGAEEFCDIRSQGVCLALGGTWDGAGTSCTGGPDNRGDMNCDGAINALDINPFVKAMTNQAAYYAQFPNCNHMYGDIDCSGAVNALDINPFVQCITGGVCPPCP